MVASVRSSADLQVAIEIERLEARHVKKGPSFGDVFSNVVASGVSTNSSATTTLDNQRQMQERRDALDRQASTRTTKPETEEEVSAAKKAEEAEEKKRMLAKLVANDEELDAALEPEEKEAMVAALTEGEVEEILKGWEKAQLDEEMRNRTYASQAEIAAEEGRMPSATDEALFKVKKIATGKLAPEMPEQTVNSEGETSAALLSLQGEMAARAQLSAGFPRDGQLMEKFDTATMMNGMSGAAGSVFGDVFLTPDAILGAQNPANTDAEGSTMGEMLQFGGTRTGQPAMGGDVVQFNSMVRGAGGDSAARVEGRTLYTPTTAAIDQMVMLAQKGADNRLERLTMQLTPPNLGMVDVKLEKNRSSGKIDLTFSFSDQQTLEDMQKEAGRLTSLLNANTTDYSGSTTFQLMSEEQQGRARNFTDKMKDFLAAGTEGDESEGTDMSGIIVYPLHATSDNSMFLDIGV